MRESVGTQQTSPTMKHSYGKSAAPGISRSGARFVRPLPAHRRPRTMTIPARYGAVEPLDFGGYPARLRFRRTNKLVRL